MPAGLVLLNIFPGELASQNSLCHLRGDDTSMDSVTSCPCPIKRSAVRENGLSQGKVGLLFKAAIEMDQIDVP